MTADDRLNRRTVVAGLLADRDGLLVVSGLGSPTWDVAAAGDHPLNAYLWGAMGGAAMIGLGLALAQPDRRVLVVTGDGEMLMGLGSLATVAMQRPPNLAVAVLDNERFGETGNQPTHTAAGLDLPGLARAAGFATVLSARSEAELGAVAEAIRQAPGPVFAALKVAAEPAPLVLPPRDGALIKDRFRRTLLGPEAER